MIKSSLLLLLSTILWVISSYSLAAVWWPRQPSLRPACDIGEVSNIKNIAWSHEYCWEWEISELVANVVTILDNYVEKKDLTWVQKATLYKKLFLKTQALSQDQDEFMHEMEVTDQNKWKQYLVYTTATLYFQDLIAETEYMRDSYYSENLDIWFWYSKKRWPVYESNTNPDIFSITFKNPEWSRAGDTIIWIEWSKTLTYKDFVSMVYDNYITEACKIQEEKTIVNNQYWSDPIEATLLHIHQETIFCKERWDCKSTCSPIAGEKMLLIDSNIPIGILWGYEESENNFDIVTQTIRAIKN